MTNRNLGFEIDGVTVAEFARIQREISDCTPLTDTVELRLAKAPPKSDMYDDFSEYE